MIERHDLRRPDRCLLPLGRSRHRHRAGASVGGDGVVGRQFDAALV